MPKHATIEVKYGRTVQPAPYESANASVGFTLAFDPEELVGDLDAEIDAALARCTDHVHRILGIGQARTRPAESKPVVEAKGDIPAPAKAAEKAKPAAKPAEKKADADPFDAPAEKKPAAKASADPFDAPAEAADKPAYTRGDANAAIQQALERLQKKGVANGPAQISEIVKAYLPDGATPPFSSNKVREDCLGDFISDLDKLGR